MPYIKRKIVNNKIVASDWTEQINKKQNWQKAINTPANWSEQVKTINEIDWRKLVQTSSPFTGYKYSYMPNEQTQQTSNLANYNDIFEINSIADAVFGTFNPYMKHAGSNAFTKAPILNIIPDACWHIYNHYIKPSREGQTSTAVVNALTVGLQEDLDFVDNALKAILTPLTNKDTTIADIPMNLAKATFFGGKEGRVNFDYDVELGNEYVNNYVNATLEIGTGVLLDVAAAFLSGGATLGLSAVKEVGEGTLQVASRETIQNLSKNQKAMATLLNSADAISDIFLKATGGVAGAYLGGGAGGLVGGLFGDEGEIIGQTLGSFLGQQTGAGTLSSKLNSNAFNKYISDIYAQNTKAVFNRNVQLKKMTNDAEVVKNIKEVTYKYQNIRQSLYNDYKENLSKPLANKNDITASYYKQLDILEQQYVADLVNSSGVQKYLQTLKPEKVQHLYDRFKKSTERTAKAINTQYKHNISTRVVNSLGFKAEQIYRKTDALVIKALPYMANKSINALSKTKLALAFSNLHKAIDKNTFNATNPKSFLDSKKVDGSKQIIESSLKAFESYDKDIVNEDIQKIYTYEVLHDTTKKHIQQMVELINETLSKDYNIQDLKALELSMQNLMQTIDNTKVIENINDYENVLIELKNKIINQRLSVFNNLDFEDTKAKLEAIRLITNMLNIVVTKKQQMRNLIYDTELFELNKQSIAQLNTEIQNLIIKINNFKNYNPLEELESYSAKQTESYDLKQIKTNIKKSLSRLEKVHKNKIIDVLKSIDVQKYSKDIETSVKNHYFKEHFREVVKFFQVLESFKNTRDESQMLLHLDYLFTARQDILDYQRQIYTYLNNLEKDNTYTNLIKFISDIKLDVYIKDTLDLKGADAVAILKYENYNVINKLSHTPTLNQIFDNKDYAALIETFPNMTPDTVGTTKYNLYKKLYEVYLKRKYFDDLKRDVENFTNKNPNERIKVKKMFLSVLGQYDKPINNITNNSKEVVENIFKSLDLLLLNADPGFKRKNMAALREKYEVTDADVTKELIKAGITENTQAHEALFDVAAQILVAKKIENVKHFNGIMLDIETSGLNIFNSKTTEVVMMREVYYTKDDGTLDTKLEVIFNEKVTGKDIQDLYDYIPNSPALASMGMTVDSWSKAHISDIKYTEADLLKSFYNTLLQLQGKENTVLKTFNGEAFDINFLLQRFKQTDADLQLKNSKVTQQAGMFVSDILKKEMNFEDILKSFMKQEDIYKIISKDDYHVNNNTRLELQEILENYIKKLSDLDYLKHDKTNQFIAPDAIYFMDPINKTDMDLLNKTSESILKNPNIEDMDIEICNLIQRAFGEWLDVAGDVKKFNHKDQANIIYPLKNGRLVDSKDVTINQLLMAQEQLTYSYNKYPIEGFNALFDFTNTPIKYDKIFLDKINTFYKGVLRIENSISNTDVLKPYEQSIIEALDFLKDLDLNTECSVIKVGMNLKENFAMLKYLIDYLKTSQNSLVKEQLKLFEITFEDLSRFLKDNTIYKASASRLFLNPDSDTVDVLDRNGIFRGVQYQSDRTSKDFQETLAKRNTIEYTTKTNKNLNKNFWKNDTNIEDPIHKVSQAYTTVGDDLLKLNQNELDTYDKYGQPTEDTWALKNVYKKAERLISQYQLNQVLNLNPEQLLSYIVHSGPNKYITFRIADEDYFNNKQSLKNLLKNKSLLKNNYIKIDTLEDGRIKLSVTPDALIKRKKYTKMTHYDSEGNLIIRSDYTVNGLDCEYVLFNEISKDALLKYFEKDSGTENIIPLEKVSELYDVRQRMVRMFPELSGRVGIIYNGKSYDKANKNPYLDIKDLEDNSEQDIYFNDFNIGDIDSQKDINEQLTGDHLNTLSILGNKMLNGSHAYIEYGQYLLNGGLRIQDDFIKNMSNEDLRNFLKDGQHVLVYLTENKNAVGGYMLRKVNNLNDNILDLARTKDITIIDYKTYEIAFEKINQFNIGGNNPFFKAWKTYIKVLKQAYLVNGIGPLFRNVIDSTVKNLNDFDSVPEMLQYTIKSTKLLMNYQSDLRQIRQMDPYLRYTLDNAKIYFNNPNTYKSKLDKETYDMIYDFLVGNGNNSINMGIHDTFDGMMMPNRFVEDTVRLTQYIRMLEKGYPENLIIKSISDRHFNYDIKEFFGNAEWGAKLGYIIPFYNYTSKNITYVTKLISENPKLFKHIMDYYGVMWRSEDYDEEELEENLSLQYQIINGNIPLKFLNPYWEDKKIVRQVSTKYGVKEQDVTNTAVLRMGSSLFDALSFYINPIANIKEKLAPPIQFIANTIADYNKNPFNNIQANKYSTYNETQEYYKNNFGASSVWSLMNADNPNRLKELLQLVPGGAALIRQLYTKDTVVQRTDNQALANMASVFGATSRWGEFKNTPYPTYSYPSYSYPSYNKTYSKTYTSAPKYNRYYNYNFNRNYPMSYRVDHKGQSVKYYLRYPQRTYYTGKTPYTAYSNMVRRIYSPNTAHRFVSNNINSNMQTIPQYLYSYYGKNRQGRSKILSWMRMSSKYKVKSTLRRIASP